MTAAPTENALIAQLGALNERSLTYGRQFWQEPFAYLGAAAIALAQVAKDHPDALRVAFFISAGAGALVLCHLFCLLAPAKRGVGAIRAVEEQLSLTPTACWTPGHLRVLMTMTALAMLLCLAAAIWPR